MTLLSRSRTNRAGSAPTTHPHATPAMSDTAEHMERDTKPWPIPVIRRLPVTRITDPKLIPKLILEGRILPIRFLILLTSVRLAVAPVILSPDTIVQSYLSALKVFDHRGMSQFWADDAVSETAGMGPDARPIDRERMRAMRGFE